MLPLQELLACHLGKDSLQEESEDTCQSKGEPTWYLEMMQFWIISPEFSSKTPWPPTKQMEVPDNLVADKIT